MIELGNALKNAPPLKVHAHWEPIADSAFNMHKSSPEHVKLFNVSPSARIKEYEAEAFELFLPPSPSPVEVGDVWAIDSGRVVQLLRQFHPGATTTLWQGSEGAFACLRAYASHYAEIVFRIHAEFILESAAHREWEAKNSVGARAYKARFIPSQFAGHVLINLKTGEIGAFSLALPPRNSNVDINAFRCADMAFVPRMELRACPTEDEDKIVWDSYITKEAARKTLALKFYKFAQINWLPIDEAVPEAKRMNRPMHTVLVWGTLDDESC